MNDILLEPGKAYNSVYKPALRQKAEALFEKKLKASGVDTAKNKASADAYRKAQSGADSLKETANKLKGWRTLFIVLLVISIVGLVIIVDSAFYEEEKGGAVLGVVLVVGILSVVMLFVLAPKIKTADQKYASAQQNADGLLSVCKTQVAPLTRLFSKDDTINLFRETVPEIVLDDNYNMRRFDYLHTKYGYPEHDGENRCSLQLLSGEIVGNPFLLEKRKAMRMGTYTYTGSITISWTTTHRDSNGNLVTDHHTEVLTAHVTKPKPYYSTQVHLIYGNEAAPHLSFGHEPTHVERMDDRERERFVKKESKKFSKKAKSGDGTFTEMSNAEFDTIFNGDDRDNEVEFRLLFTPLAQKNMLALMKGESPYGDDFYFYKRGCINDVQSEHSQITDYSFSPVNYVSYDVEQFKTQFVEAVDGGFRSLFFDLAPLLAIPLYQQHKPREFIYKEAYERHFTAREAECLASRFPDFCVAPQNLKTPLIYKTSLVDKANDHDTVAITAYGYTTVKHTDIQTVLGGDGHVHAVPVDWLEYIPVNKTTIMTVYDAGKNVETKGNKIYCNHLQGII